jgi:hypothetical protein
VPIRPKQKSSFLWTPKLALLAAFVVGGFSLSSSWIIHLNDLSNPVVILPVHHSVRAASLPQVLGAVTKAVIKKDNSDLVKFADNPTVFLVRREGLYPFATYDGLLTYTKSAPRIRLVKGTSNSYPVISFIAEDMLRFSSGSPPTSVLSVAVAN